MLEACTVRRVQRGLDRLGPIRLPGHARHPLLVQGMEEVPDGLDSAASQWGNGVRRQPTRTREDALGTADAAGVRRAPVGLQRHTLIVGYGADKEWWFHHPRIPLEAPWHKNSSGDALARLLKLT